MTEQTEPEPKPVVPLQITTGPANQGEALKEPYELRTFGGPEGEIVYGLYPLSGAPPRFQGEAMVCAKPAGPLPGVDLSFRFDIAGADGPADAFALFDAACQKHEGKAKQDAAKEWHRRYGREAQVAGMKRQGILDATGAPIQRRFPK